jgi:hypothetical protein
MEHHLLLRKEILNSEREVLLRDGMCSTVGTPEYLRLDALQFLGQISQGYHLDRLSTGSITSCLAAVGVSFLVGRTAVAECHLNIHLAHYFSVADNTHSGTTSGTERAKMEKPLDTRHKLSYSIGVNP